MLNVAIKVFTIYPPIPYCYLLVPQLPYTSIYISVPALKMQMVSDFHSFAYSHLSTINSFVLLR